MMEEILADAKPENQFITKDGQRIKNLYQLQKTLVKMDEDIFNHHVNEERNDFCNWITDIYKDKSLANEVVKCKTKDELSQKIKEKLDQAIKTKKEHDVRRIIEQAKKDVEEKRKTFERSKPSEEPKIKTEEKKQHTEIKRHEPKTEKHVFVNRPPRSFTKEEKPVKISNATYMKASVIDFVFGIIIGVIAILILKQLL